MRAKSHLSRDNGVSPGHKTKRQDVSPKLCRGRPTKGALLPEWLDSSAIRNPVLRQCHSVKRLVCCMLSSYYSNLLYLVSASRSLWAAVKSTWFDWIYLLPCMVIMRWWKLSFSGRTSWSVPLVLNDVKLSCSLESSVSLCITVEYGIDWSVFEWMVLFILFLRLTVVKD